MSRRSLYHTHGGIREISVEDPAPGEGGFRSVVSTSVQPSPLAPHPPKAVCQITFASGMAGGSFATHTSLKVTRSRCRVRIGV